jgi:predicted metallopeptidase
MQNIITVNDFNGKFVISEAYRPIAQALVNKYSELEHINVDNILFIENTETRKKKNNSLVFAQISLMQEKWKDIIYQITEQNYTHILEIFKLNTLMMSREQIIALIYHELRHIGKDGSIINHDIEDWANMIEKLGVDWSKYEADIPNILQVDWESIEGPTTLFSTEVTLRVVK